jgi:hypothetical protein
MISDLSHCMLNLPNVGKLYIAKLVLHAILAFVNLSVDIIIPCLTCICKAGSKMFNLQSTLNH